MQMRGKPRCRFVTGTNWPIVDTQPAERPLWVKWEGKGKKAQKLTAGKRKRKKNAKPTTGNRKDQATSRPAISEPQSAVLVACPHCGCSVTDTRLKKHLRRCPVAALTPTVPPKSVSWVMLTVAEMEATRDRSPAGIARQTIKDDNILRSWLQRQRKDLLRRLELLDIEGGIEFTDLCAIFEGRHILMDQLVRQYLRLSELPESGLLGQDTLTGFIAYVRSCAGDSGLERFPLRTGFRLLSPEQRALLAAQGSGDYRQLNACRT